MKLSVVVPVYNASSKILILLNSVLKSKLDFEVICINDGSTDNTLEIIKTINDRRLKVYTKNNEGTFKAWQYGVKKASGEYLAILDQDDYIDTNYIDFIYDTITDYGVDVIFTPYYYEKENGEKKYDLLPFADGYYNNIKLEEIRQKLISGRVPYAKFSKVIKKSLLIEQITYYDDIVIRDFEDWLTMIQVFSKMRSIFIFNKPFYHYIQYSNANSVSKSTISYRRNYDSMQKMISALSDSIYVQIDNHTLDMVFFYASRIMINKCTKIRELDLAHEIMHGKRFRNCIFKSSVGIHEKILFFIGSPRLYYYCYRLLDAYGRFHRTAGS